jgi:hypothetical protein
VLVVVVVVVVVVVRTCAEDDDGRFLGDGRPMAERRVGSTVRQHRVPAGSEIPE